MLGAGLRIACLLVTACVTALSVSQAAGREWNLGGILKFEAELEGYDGKKARLRQQNGEVWNLEIEKLSAEDRAYLTKNYPNGKERVGKPKVDPSKSGPAKKETESPAASDTAPAAGPPDAKAAPVKPADLSVELISLTVTKSSGATAGLVPGTHATLFVSCPTALVGLDAEKTKIVCADDRANNLSKPTAGGDAKTEKDSLKLDDVAADSDTKPVRDGLSLDVASDGKSGTIVLDFPRAPNPKATRIRLKGELHIMCGSKEAPQSVVVPLTLIVSLGL